MAEPRRGPSVAALIEGVRRCDRALLGRAITLVESRRPSDRDRSRALLEGVLDATGGAVRVGITGVPGAGKSTLIEVLGQRLLAAGHRVAVLAIDPSSTVSRGSILGDKTRMTALARDPRAFVRPSPSRGTLGGVASTTRETILVCEAAGFDVVLVETVGVGQSEALVADMVDCLLLVLLAGAGDELQGMKRGILERVDVVAINKADGDNVVPAQKARAQLEAALRFVRPPSRHWRPPVLTCSAQEDQSIDTLWQQVLDHRATLEAHDALTRKRRDQQRGWLWARIVDGLEDAFRRAPAVAAVLAEAEAAVAAGTRTPDRAASDLLAAFLGARTST